MDVKQTEQELAQEGELLSTIRRESGGANLVDATRNYLDARLEGDGDDERARMRYRAGCKVGCARRSQTPGHLEQLGRGRRNDLR